MVDRRSGPARTIDARTIERTDPGYPAARRALSVSAWQPPDQPVAIVRAADAEDVIAAVDRARRTGTRVTVRSGGHNLSATHLRQDALALDLRDLKHVELDPDRHTAWLGPGLTALEAARHLDTIDHGFPLGHASSVGLGGYLLAGGNGWNSRQWGAASARVLAADVVTADGRLLQVDAASQPELLAVLRGAGPAFPGVVTRFQLDLVPGRRRLTQLAVTLPGRRGAELGAALDKLLPTLAPEVEVTIAIGPGAEGDDGDVEDPGASRSTIVVTGMCFTRDGQRAEPLLDPLRGLEQLGGRADLDDLGRSLGDLLADRPGIERDAMVSHHAWSSASCAQLLPPLVRAAAGAPSDPAGASSILLTAATGPQEVGAAVDALYRPLGRTAVSVYAHWDPHRGRVEDARRWARSTVTDLGDLCAGHYIGEIDLTGPAQWVGESFTPDAWRRLLRSRAAVDPNHLFAGPLDGVLPPDGTLLPDANPSDGG